MMTAAPYGIAPGFLLIGAALSLTYLIGFCWRGPGLIKTLVKTGAVAAPAFGISLAGASGWALAGLWACVAGDFLLSRPGEAWLKSGIAAFALGHIFYVLALLTGFGPGFGADWIGGAVPLALLLLGLSTELWLIPHCGPLKGPVRFYVLLILVMGGIAAQLPIPRIPVLAGALTFILSDLILSVELFVLSGGWFGRLAPFFIWFFYYAAQVLLFMGFMG
ncbi:lysoplasmalogenase family protein [Thalassovita sp.]|uniref:lysoplasmalogenase family protein n=1 Tax=Thalassovita sp. TaxID=1979401 RepID=UPI002B26B868|nr:lysoplasmalogenase family protein [Thalassovita sp.]